MATNSSLALGESPAAAWHRWCRMSPAEQLICCTAVPSPFIFAAFLLAVFRRPLRAISEELAFFAGAQRALLTLETLELAGFAVLLVNIRILHFAAGRAIVLYLSSTAGFACQLITKLYLLGLTLLRICAIRHPMHFLALDQRRCLSQLMMAATLSAVAAQLALYRFVWGGSLTTEWRPQLSIRLPNVLRTYAWFMAAQTGADSLLAPATFALALAVRKRRRRLGQGRRRRVADLDSAGERLRDATTDRAILAESLAGILVTSAMIINAANAELSDDRWRRRLRPFIYASAVPVVAAQKLGCVLVPVLTCHRLREQIFASAVFCSQLWSRRIPPLLRLTVTVLSLSFVAFFFGGWLRWLIPDC